MIARILVLILSFQVSDVSIVRMNPIPLRDANETDRGMRLEATLRAPFPVASVTMYCRPAGASEYQALLLGRDKRLNYVAVYPRTIALDYYLVVRPTRGEPIPVWSAEDPATLDPAGIAATVIEGGKGKSILISVVTAIAALIGTGIGAAGPAGNEPSAPPPVTTLPPAASPSPPVSPTPTPSAAPSPPSQSDTASAHGERSSDLDRWNHISGSWTECGGAGTLVVTVAGESIRGSLHRGGTVITLSGYRQTGLPEDWILVAMNKAPERSAVHGVLKAIAHDPRRQPALVLRIDGRSDLSFCR